MDEISVKSLFDKFKLDYVATEFKFFPATKNGNLRFYTAAKVGDIIKFANEFIKLAAEQQGAIICTNDTPRLEDSPFVVSQLIVDKNLTFMVTIKSGQVVKKRNKKLNRLRAELIKMYGIKLEVELDE